MKRLIFSLFVGLLGPQVWAADTVICVEKDSNKLKATLSFSSQPNEGDALTGPLEVEVTFGKYSGLYFKDSFNAGQRRDVVQYKNTNEEIYIVALGTDRSEDESDAYVSLVLSARLGADKKYYGQLNLTSKDGAKRPSVSLVCMKDLEKKQI